MAKVFLTNINLKGNQLLNAALQPASSAPNASGAGQVYYNTNTQALYFSTGSGTGNWQQLAAGTTSVASLNNETGAITLQGTADYITVDTTGSTITINIDTKVATTDGTQTLENKTLLEPTLKGRISLTDGNDNETAYIEHSYTGTTRITAGDDLALRSTDGDIILYPGNDNGGPGKAYIHWGDDSSGSYPQREIATIGTSQTFTNKTIGDQLTFNDGSNDSSIDVDGNNLYINANNNLQLSTANGDIDLNPDGSVNVNSTLNANNGVVTTSIYNNNEIVIESGGNDVTVVADGEINLNASTNINGNGYISGSLQVDGDLNVNGTLNAINRTEINIEDNTIRLNTGFTGAPTADAGIIVERGTGSDTAIIWSETNDSWQLTNDGSNYYAIARKYVSVIGDASNTSFDVVHNLGTRDVTVQVYQNSSEYDIVETDVKNKDGNTVTVSFTDAPSVNAYKVVIVG